jgi:predicted lipoprotein
MAMAKFFPTSRIGSWCAVLVGSLGLAGAGCQPSGRSQVPSEQAVVTAFVQKVVEPNYTQLVARSDELKGALQRLAGAPNAANLTAARNAWRAARQTWETSESWAFGPAETEGFDGAMDDWPVNRRDLAKGLEEVEFSESTFAALSDTAKGFHGIEWVLFGGGRGSEPAAEQLTPAELTYLRLAGADLHRQAEGLLASWSGAKGFGAQFSAPEEVRAALQELLQGVIGSLQEEGDEKLGQPLATRNPQTLESADSGNTQADLVANIAGARQVLLDTGLLELIRSRDAALARELEREISRALAMARALPHPLNDHLRNPDSRRAMEALIAQLHATAGLAERSAKLFA